LIVIALPLLFPLLIGGVIASRINTSQFKQRYSAFLSECEDMVFFCYTNRKHSQKYIEQHILPQLDPSINVIFLQGREPHSEFDKRCISHMLFLVTNLNFPNLIHISNGQVFDVSLHKDLQNIMDQEHDPASFVQLIQEKGEELRLAGRT